MSWNTINVAPFDTVEYEIDGKCFFRTVFLIENEDYKGNRHVGVGKTKLELWVDVAKIKNVIKSTWRDVEDFFQSKKGDTISVYAKSPSYHERIPTRTSLCATIDQIEVFDYKGYYHLRVLLEDGRTDWISYQDVAQTHLFTIPLYKKGWRQCVTSFEEKIDKKINFRINTTDNERNGKSYNEHFQPDTDLIGTLLSVETNDYAGDYHIQVRLEDGTEDWISYEEYVSDHICEPEAVGLILTPQLLKNLETNSIICDNSNISDVQIQRAIDQIHFIRTTQPKVELTMQNQQTDVITTVTAQIKQASIINAKIVAGKGALEIVSNVVKRQLPENMQHFVEHPLFSALCASVLCALQVQFLANNPKAQLISESIILAGTNNVMSMLNLEQLVSGLFDQFAPLLENIPTDVINTDK